MAKNKSEPERIGQIVKRVLKDIRKRMRNKNETEKTNTETKKLSLYEEPVEGLSRQAESGQVPSEIKQKGKAKPENPKDNEQVKI